MKNFLTLDLKIFTLKLVHSALWDWHNDVTLLFLKMTFILKCAGVQFLCSRENLLSDYLLSLEINYIVACQSILSCSPGSTTSWRYLLLNQCKRGTREFILHISRVIHFNTSYVMLDLVWEFWFLRGLRG